jgi:hypothetical protein
MSQVLVVDDEALFVTALRRASARNTVPLSGCYAGDYQGATADLGNPSRFFYAWGEIPAA